MSKVTWYLSFCAHLISLNIMIFSFIHVVIDGRLSSILMAKYYCMVYMYHISLIHSSLDGHLGCSHFMAIVTSAAVNKGVQMSL
jgi:hypothetical protein